MIYSVSGDRQLTLSPGEVSTLLPRGWEDNEHLVGLPNTRVALPTLEQIAATKQDRLRSAPINGLPALTGRVIKLTSVDLQESAPKALEVLALNAFDVARSRAGIWPHNDIKRLSGPTELARATKLYEGLHEIVKVGGLVHIIYLPYLAPETRTK